MAIPLQKFREIVFQLLYSHDLAKVSEDEMTPLLMKELSVTKKTVRSAQEKVNQILEKCDEIDALIRQTSQSYRFERIHTTERNILRLGVYELLYDDTIPPKVAISEAMRLSKKFSTPEAATFVNALLDAIYQSSLGEELDHKNLSESAEKMIKSQEIASEVSKKKKSHEDH